MAGGRGVKSGEARVRLRELPRVEAIQCQAGSRADAEVIGAYLALVTVASSAQVQMEALYSENALSRGRFVVLMLLRNSEGGASTPAELALQSSVTTATMTGLLDGLEAQGLVRREHRADDRRSVRIELTARAHAMLERFLPKHFASIARIMDRLTRPELAQLSALLVKLYGAPDERVEDSEKSRGAKSASSKGALRSPAPRGTKRPRTPRPAAS